MDQVILEKIEEMRLEIITLKMRFNSLESRLDDEDTYSMEQNEKR